MVCVHMFFDKVVFHCLCRHPGGSKYTVVKARRQPKSESSGISDGSNFEHLLFVIGVLGRAVL